ncbi:amidohydrolase [Evansella tamaricis]|uniref:Amidohydrolase n=1 Tax=Evansella tamaricis TaxID=2069301 RepID=A0ABS6JLV5_9BACI|nr:amidohydrolase [Evansella tamaricis]
MGTLWFGGKIRTLYQEDEICEAVFVENGVIIDVGKENQLRTKYAGKITDFEDVMGAVMYPGFVDSHLHMIGHGEKLLRLDLSEVNSIEKLKHILLNTMEKLSPDDWLIGEGFNENLFPSKKIPDRFVLDEISQEQPIVLSRVCRHALVTNTMGLQLAGITEQTNEPPGGVIVKDEAGVPTGYLLDQAQELVKEVMPTKSLNYIKRAMEASLKDLYRHGFVGAHTEDLNYYGDPIGTLRTFYDVIDGKRNKFRANLLIHHEVTDQIMALDERDHSFIELGSVKIFADGALGGRTALLSEPYSDDKSTQGVAIHTPDELSEIVKGARELEMPVAIHVIGDLALEYALNAIEKYPVPDGKRDRLIHLQVTREDLIQRMKKLPLILDIQPRFVATDFPWVEERLGQERIPYSFAWRRLLQEGLLCAGGSDAPIEPVNPILGIHAAVTRRKPNDENHEGYIPTEKLSLFEALRLFTVGSAEAINKEAERGMIRKGYVADFTILSKDLFDLSPDEWLNVEVEKTIVDNSVMYDRKML